MKSLNNILTGVFGLVFSLSLAVSVEAAAPPTASVIIPTGDMSVAQGTQVSFSGMGTATAETAGTRTDYPVGLWPQGVAFDPVTNSIWVANRDAGTVSKVNINTGTKTDYPVGVWPRTLAFDSVTNSMWVTNTNSNTVSKVNVNTGTRTDYFTGNAPYDVIFDPVTNSMWVANTTSNTISKIDVNTGTRIDYPVGVSPLSATFDSVTNSVWVANSSSNTVSKVNINTGTRIDYPVGVRPTGMAFDSTTNSVWATNYNSNTVSKVNINTGTKTDYPVGSNPIVAYFEPVTNSVWVTNASSNTVSKVNVNAGTRIDYAVGAVPRGVTFDPVTNSVWVANRDDNTVSKISIGANSITTYEWREGDCNTGTLLSSDSSFNKSDFTAGSHTISLRVQDSLGVWSTNCPSRNVTVEPTGPALSCSVNNTTIIDTAQAQNGASNGTPQAIDKVGNYVYAGATGPDSAQGLYIYDVSDPTNITQLSFFSTFSPALVQNNTWGNDVLSVDVVGNYAYLATLYGGLVIVDVSNPAAPVFSGKIVLYNLNSPGAKETWDVEVVGNYAFLAAGKGLIVVDVSNKANPVVVANKDYGATVSQDIVVSGNYAYVGMRDKGFSIVDISDPVNPVEQARVTAGYDGSVWAYSMEKKGDILYVADHFAQRISLYNVSNPTAPSLVKTVPTPISGNIDAPRELHIENNVLYVAAGRGGLYVFDVTDPTNPAQLIGLFKPPLPSTAKIWGVVPLDSSDFTKLTFVSQDTAAGLYTTETICDPQPDLTAIFNPATSFTTGTAVVLTGTVTNSGSSDISTSFSDNLTYRYGNSGAWLSFSGNTVNHPSLNQTQNVNDSFTFNPPSAGTNLYLQYCVDSNMVNAYGEIDEGVSEGNNCVESGPFTVTAPATCPISELLTWTDGGTNSCRANTTSSKNSGETLSISDNDPNPSIGTASFTCRDDGTWDPTPTFASCSIPATPPDIIAIASPKIIRSGEISHISVTINSPNTVTCSFLNADATTPNIENKPSGTYIKDTKPLTSAQIVTVICTDDITLLTTTKEVRVDVVPRVQEI